MVSSPAYRNAVGTYLMAADDSVGQLVRPRAIHGPGRKTPGFIICTKRILLCLPRQLHRFHDSGTQLAQVVHDAGRNGTVILLYSEKGGPDNRLFHPVG